MKRLLKTLLATATAATLLIGCGASGGNNVVTPVPSAGQPAPANTVAPTGFSAGLRRELDAAVTTLREKMGVTGVVVRLTVPGFGTYATTSGVSDRETNAPLRLDQHFRIGSVTKTFSVTAILQLLDEGRLSLDDPISKYVPTAPRPTATLLELANMSSGIASYTFSSPFQAQLFANPHRLWAPQELVDIAAAVTNAGCPLQAQACFEPGMGFFYCDTNTTLLGMVIEKVTGKSYAAVLQEKIFTPLGLSQTTAPLTGDLPSPFIHGYTPQGLASGLQEATDWNPSYAFADGNIVSTLDDLEKWLPALGRGTLLKPSTQALRLVPNPYADNPARSYLVGMASENGWLGHTGAIFGYNVFAYCYPANDATIIVVVNQDLATLDGRSGDPSVFIAREVLRLASREAPVPPIQ